MHIYLCFKVKTLRFLTYFFFIAVIFLTSCSGSNSGDADEIREYVKKNNIPVLDTLGIFIYISDEGNLERPKAESTVELSYTGRYLDDVIFDKVAEGREIKMKLATAIPGLRKGLSLFGKNGIGTIFIPSDEAYGSNPPFGIRENAILIYDIKINNF